MNTPPATALRSAWAEVLDIDLNEIEDDSNFVSLGGDSVQAMKLAAIAPLHGLDLDTETIFQEGVFSKLLARTKLLDTTVEQPDETTTPSVTTDTDLIQTCAEACGISQDMVEDVYPPNGVAARFFTTHQESGAWLLQIVFQLQNGLSAPLVCKAFEAIHDHNDTFRSRFVLVNDEVQTVVTKSPVAWNRSDSLETYKAEDRSQKVNAGQPAVRYGLIQEPAGKSYVVWTALHSAMDGWTRKLLCDDLEAFFADPDALSQKPKRPSMKKYLDFIKNADPAPARAFWSTYLTDLPAQNPIEGSDTLPVGGQPVCNRKIMKKFPLDKPSIKTASTIRLSTIAHAAFAILLATLTSSTDVIFMGLRASRTVFPGADQIMGSIFSAVPIRIRFSPAEPIRDLLARMQDESNAMLRHEPWGGEAWYQAQSQMEGKENHLLSFQWYPKGMDLSKRRVCTTGGSGDEERDTLRVVEEKYSPHTFAGCLNAYDNRDSFRVQSEFDDRIYNVDFIEKLIGRFARLLERIRQVDGSESVESLLVELEP
ncbi:MAG: hypothetical protein L6R38_001409 [Xanthoria sp. 2 TBL-2021]|nr:MAG: hypothetical protein L6R38_001409 [Xanthoria sp. 2 TBL-2021]